MQFELPLTLTLSPSEGEREKIARRLAWSPDGDLTLNARRDSLSPSEGERVRVRILRNKTSRFEPLNRQRRVGLGVLTPPRPSDVSSMPGGGVRTPSPTFRSVGWGSFN